MPSFGFSRERLGPVARRAANAGLCAVALGLAWHFELLPCPWALLFGIPCPGCGLSRAARRLFDGDLSGALLLHPLSPVVVPLVLAVCARAACQHVLGGAPASCRVSPALRRAESLLAWWLAGLMLAVWATRFLGAFAGPVRVISLWAH